VSPLPPDGPVGPGSPLPPIAPVAPGAPSAPCGPAGPVSPLGPGEPVAVPGFLREKLAVAMQGKSADDRLFTSTDGAVLRNGNFRRDVFDRAVRSVDLAGFTPHEPKHTAASLAITVGASVKAVQRVLGHASATLTLDRYGHLFGDELDSVADRLDQHRANFPRTFRGLGTVTSLTREGN
jgi:hypothetical protein